MQMGKKKGRRRGRPAETRDEICGHGSGRKGNNGDERKETSNGKAGNARSGPVAKRCILTSFRPWPPLSATCQSPGAQTGRGGAFCLRFPLRWYSQVDAGELRVCRGRPHPRGRLPFPSTSLRSRLSGGAAGWAAACSGRVGRRRWRTVGPRGTAQVPPRLDLTLTDFAALQGLGFPRLPESNVVGKPPHAILDEPENSGAGTVALALCVQYMRYVHDVSSASLRLFSSARSQPQPFLWESRLPPAHPPSQHRGTMGLEVGRIAFRAGQLSGYRGWGCGANAPDVTGGGEERASKTRPKETERGKPIRSNPAGSVSAGNYIPCLASTKHAPMGSRFGRDRGRGRLAGKGWVGLREAMCVGCVCCVCSGRRT